MECDLLERHVQRTTISIDESLGAAFDEMVEAQGYASRSEAVRDLVRQAVEDWRNQRGGGEPCVANFSFVYDQDIRSLANRLSEWRHAHHDLIIAATLVPLDHHDTLENLMLKGEAGAVRALADGIKSERGVRFGMLNLIAVDIHDVHADQHPHQHSGRPHLSPKLG